MPIWLRSLFSWIAWVALTLVLGPTVGAVALVSHRASFRVSRAWARLLLRAAGIDVEVMGRENTDPERPTVYVSNHHSYLDVISLIAFFPVNLIFVAKTTLLILPGLNIAMWCQGHIFVPRKRPTRAIRRLRRQGVIYLEEGKNVLIFPGGGRSVDASVGEFKGGAAALAIWAGAPMAPAAIAGSSEVLPRGNWPLKPGKVIINIGQPIVTGGLSIREHGKITAAVKERVCQLKKEADERLAHS